ncbi:MAG TPA: COX15/CtaA family protein [Gemmatimonadales bacterium]|nr:COX15/CtaA family protein [Gemmatimonadales bacterium]
MTHDSPAARRLVGRWLALWAGMVFLTVLIGGATRLTESGLSITEWNPVTGVVPPLSEGAWQAEFAKYQQIPEYQQLNRGMSLAEFKQIFLWEYVHRLWARLVGLAFAVPLAIFVLRRMLAPALARRLGLVLVLTGLQAAMGWYMVKSGLAVRTDVSQYRLAAHLGLALVIYVLTVWTAADLLRGEPAAMPGSAAVRRRTVAFAGLTFLTAVAGAFVAGLDAGRAYNTFPLMGGRLVPDGYLQLTPWWRNMFEHVPAVQFNHRLLGIATVAMAISLWWLARRATLPEPAVRLTRFAAIVAMLQVGLGIATLLLAVPVSLGVLHQAGAVALLTVAILLLHSLRPVPVAAVLGNPTLATSA